ncbi:flagellar basal body rod protein [Actinoplanes sp. ATCC 53533]|uniref:flagellar basal body-associated FliL family protein n=1 Tax=Actinoplanes sp. ATCC 53533 TaxID=1288362 RepID=UPI000F7B4BDB|nr:flagellar basal body-associated FliL family protein [Actinoplanes sp. ATCC 53533]RSM39582.1 flagellar basal body rod protein [Actinoplanes sp. ATCC 53533]
MSKDDKDAATESPKKSKKMLMIVVLAVVLLGGGGAGAWFFFLKGDAAEAAPVKGAVVAIEETMTINLADAHYLKLGFALQMTEEAGEEEFDTAEAIDLAIDQYTGMEIAELETEKGRLKAKDELLEKIEKAYNVEDKHLVMGIYFTSFVTQ